MAMKFISRPKRFRDDEIVVAVTSFAVDGVAEVIVRGTRLRASHAAVRKASQYFAPDGTPPNEWPSEFDAAGEELARVDRRERAERAKHAPPEIPLEDQVICTQTFSKGARFYGVGVIYRRDDPAVKDPATREYFGTPARPLGT